MILGLCRPQMRHGSNYPPEIAPIGGRHRISRIPPEMAGELEARVRPAIERQLEAGEELRGVCVATQQSTFRGRMVVIGVTPGRLLLQPVDRKLSPSGRRFR